MLRRHKLFVPSHCLLLLFCLQFSTLQIYLQSINIVSYELYHDKMSSNLSLCTVVVTIAGWSPGVVINNAITATLAYNICTRFCVQNIYKLAHHLIIFIQIYNTNPTE